MPFNIFFKEEGLHLWVVFTSILSLDDMRLAWEKTTEDMERFKTVQYIITDYSKASMEQWNSMMAATAADWLKHATEINTNITLIEIMGDQLNYGIARMLLAFAGEIPWKTILVRTHEEFEKIPLK